MTRYEYERVRKRESRRGRCPECGKAVTRSRTFENTINPFNRNPDGSVRSREQVRECVIGQARAWEPDFTHQGCTQPPAGER